MKMGIGSVGQLTGVKAVGVEMGWAASGKLAARPCDNCRSAAAAVFCKADAAFLCLGCDSGIHGANKLSSRHQRVWMCEVCERAPAAVACKADAAVLCVSCDEDIHSVNPLACRHERFPVDPFYDAVESVAKVSGISFLVVPGSGGVREVEEEVATSWLLPNPTENLAKKGGGLSAFDEMDPSPSLSFEDENSIDGVVCGTATDGLVPTGGTNRSLGKGFDIDFRRSKISPLISENIPDQSLSHSVSSSSHDFGVVPDSGNSKGGAEASDPFIRSLSVSTNTDPCIAKGTMATVNQATRLRGLDREARVVRYREKRKNRKFEKTVRYASRKAYAEARPRIKGRFVKRTEAEDDSISGASPGDGFLENKYGLVPTF